MPADLATGAIATLDALQAALPDGDLPLVVQLPDGPLGAAFHLTEVKHARITSLDCGRGAHAWDEVVVQLLDGEQGTPLTADKLRAILGEARTQSGAAFDSALFFESGRGNKGLQKFELADVVETEAGVMLEMHPVTAMCKPSLMFERKGAAASCSPAPAPASAGCC